MSKRNGFCINNFENENNNFSISSCICCAYVMCR